MKYLKTFEDNNSKIDTLGIVKTNSKSIKESEPITTNRKVLQRICDSFTEAYENNERSLSCNLSNEIENIFGTHNKLIRLEFLTKVWELKYYDLTFNIFTSKKGTAIEICNLPFQKLINGDREDDIISFLDLLYALVNNKSLEDLKIRHDSKKYNL